MSIDFELDSSEYIDFGDVNDLTSTLTICCWVKFESLPPTAGAIDRWLVGKDDNANGRSFAFGVRNTDPSTYLNWQAAGTAPADFGSTALSTGTWFHVAVTHNNTGDAVGYFLNGASDGTTTNAGNVSDVAADLRIASRSFATSEGYFDGEIEDVRIYNSILTLESIALLAAGYRGPIGGELGWWDMNTARGQSGGFDGASLATGETLPDLSDNDNSGTPTNTPTGRGSTAPRYGVLA